MIDEILPQWQFWVAVIAVCAIVWRMNAKLDKLIEAVERATRQSTKEHGDLMAATLKGMETLEKHASQSLKNNERDHREMLDLFKETALVLKEVSKTLEIHTQIELHKSKLD